MHEYPKPPTAGDDVGSPPTDAASAGRAREPVGHCLICGASARTLEVETHAMMQTGSRERFTFMRCSNCGLVQLDPRVPPAELGAFYQDDYLPYRGPLAWGRFAHLVERDLERVDAARVATLRRFVPLSEGSQVLDVGCGKPSFLRRLIDEVACTGVGTDFTDAGWRDHPETWRGLHLVAGEVVPAAGGDALPDEALGGPFDAITMWHYLEHEYHPRALLTRLAELARDKATLVIEVPDHDGWTRRRHGRFWQGYHTPRHTALYTPETLRRLLEDTGWQVVHQERRGTLDAHALEWMSRMERRGIDWTSSMEPHFVGFVAGLLAFRARHALKRGQGLGIQTAVARRA